jgi:protocatechuate 3,4-dioxygenase beta subunit
MNNNERKQWIANDEGLYNWQLASGLSMREFIKQNRVVIDEAIRNVRDGVNPPHYLAYHHGAGCRCYHCTHRRIRRI